MSPEMALIACRSDISTEHLDKLRASEGRLTIYISGPMFGHNDADFYRVEEMIRTAGHIPLNPARNPRCLTKYQKMKLGISDLSVCNAVVRLRGWMESKESLAEVFTAYSLDLTLIDET